MLIKGIVLTLAFGLLSMFGILGVEYFLWLNSIGRLLLFFVFIVLVLFLFYRFIFVPLLYLFKVKNGITNKDASRLIGKHFPEVADRLYNLLDLADDKNQSELLMASIEQRSERLRPIPFTRAIDYKENLKYSKYLVLPILVFGAIYLSGNLTSFFNSYNRVVNYDLAYAPPAPFTFELVSKELKVLGDKSYTIYITTQGDIRPDAVNIRINGKELLLQQENGLYKYTFTPPLEDSDFQFFSGNVESKFYHLQVLDAPTIQNFTMEFDYPDYLNRTSEVLKSTGNAILPEGTQVTWKMVGENTESIHLVDKDTVRNFTNTDKEFILSNRVFDTYDYQITTSNKYVTDYEKLDYRFTIVKDAYPTIKVSQVLDSLNPNVSYFVGESSDDYGLSTIKMVCYAEGKEEDRQYVNISEPNTNFKQFYYTFPSGLRLTEGVDYQFYFIATDNDGIHKGKSVKSQIFTYNLLNDDQLLKKELESQQSIIGNMDRSLEKYEEQEKALDKINREQKEKKELNYNDENQIKDFLGKQKEQEELMQQFSKQLKENLEKNAKDDNLNKLLQERLERQELEAIKNEKLLDELNKIANKIDKEELTKRLEQLGKNQQNSKRNLEQLLELTKRYYVTEKMAQMAKELNKLAEDQQSLSELEVEKFYKEENQEELNTTFKELIKDLEELLEDNRNLQKPLDLIREQDKEESIKQDQEEALEEIAKQRSNNDPSDSKSKSEGAEKAKQKQKSAADKIKEMAEELNTATDSASGSSGITEDAEMLRQILDNLVTFSFKEETLFESVEEMDLEIANFSGTVRKQNELRSLFEHVDDSLFALSLRRAELSEFVNQQITDVYYNMDKSLESLSENQIYQGVSYQKYVLNASNELSNFLADILDNMQQSMQAGAGKGQGDPGFQLPDIIKGQGELKEKMEGMGQSGQGQPQEGEGSGKEGQGTEKGSGKDGTTPRNTKEGNKGENGESGEGAGNQNGRNGNANGQDGASEKELKEIYEIYKQQQRLREQLEQQLSDMIKDDDRQLGEKLIKQMEDFENDLIENGVTQRTRNKMNVIEHELLKLENATLSKGKKSERESNTNIHFFNNPVLTKPSILQQYRNDVEVLDRQALPLHQNYQNKVKEYFKDND
ncbi:MAG: hypothetical protein WBM98_04285 [Maribacter sp.]|uniref:hypothetical protein n=1 Tax=Maribacter sp. TaxID=1897614 RepID=UPI003C773084